MLRDLDLSEGSLGLPSSFWALKEPAGCSHGSPTHRTLLLQRAPMKRPSDRNNALCEFRLDPTWRLCDISGTQPGVLLQWGSTRRLKNHHQLSVVCIHHMEQRKVCFHGCPEHGESG